MVVKEMFLLVINNKHTNKKERYAQKIGRTGEQLRENRIVTAFVGIFN
jgi:hypothetical protein